MSGVVVTQGKLSAGRLDVVGLASLALVVIFGASPIPSTPLSLFLTLSSSRLGCTIVSVNKLSFATNFVVASTLL